MIYCRTDFLIRPIAGDGLGNPSYKCDRPILTRALYVGYRLCRRWASPRRTSPRRASWAETHDVWRSTISSNITATPATGQARPAFGRCFGRISAVRRARFESRPVPGAPPPRRIARSRKADRRALLGTYRPLSAATWQRAARRRLRRLSSPTWLSSTRSGAIRPPSHCPESNNVVRRSLSSWLRKSPDSFRTGRPHIRAARHP